MIFALQIGAALLMDYLCGDPRWLPHPVRLIGWFCKRCEQVCRRVSRFIGLQAAGAVTFAAVLAATGFLTWGSLTLLDRIEPQAAGVAAFLLLYLCLAAGDLVTHSSRVSDHLAAGEIEAARAAVALLVGRDTDSLDGTGIARACVESVAENLVDGVTAPIFWAACASLVAVALASPPLIGAAVGAMMYKAVNTMDSMIGYRNEAYLQFGSWAARADDLANFVPARLSGLCVVAAAALSGLDGRAAFTVFAADRLKSSSPNSGHTEAAVAGALNRQLGGVASYFGQTCAKPLIGAGFRKPDAEDIVRCNRLVLRSTVVFAAVALLARHLVLLVLP